MVCELACCTPCRTEVSAAELQREMKDFKVNIEIHQEMRKAVAQKVMEMDRPPIQALNSLTIEEQKARAHANRISARNSKTPKLTYRSASVLIGRMGAASSAGVSKNGNGVKSARPPVLHSFMP